MPFPSILSTRAYCSRGSSERRSLFAGAARGMVFGGAGERERINFGRTHFRECDSFPDVAICV